MNKRKNSSASGERVRKMPRRREESWSGRRIQVNWKEEEEEAEIQGWHKGTMHEVDKEDASCYWVEYDSLSDDGDHIFPEQLLGVDAEEWKFLSNSSTSSGGCDDNSEESYVSEEVQVSRATIILLLMFPRQNRKKVKLLSWLTHISCEKQFSNGYRCQKCFELTTRGNSCSTCHHLEKVSDRVGYLLKSLGTWL
jgi:hypothetical protein